MNFIDEFYSEQMKETLDRISDDLYKKVLNAAPEAEKQEDDSMYKNLEITFKSGETITYKPGEWDDYSFTGSAVVVKKNSTWIGIYNFNNVFCVELKK